VLMEGAAPVCLTDAQVKNELQRFIAQHEEEHNPLPKGMGTIYYLLTPPGLTVCLDQGGPEGHCSDFNGTPSEIADYEEANSNYPEEVEKYEEALKKYEEAKADYEAHKAEREAKHEPEPTKPVEPTEPGEAPAGLADYEKSFCSYHGNIGAGAGAILYAAIPWTAGGDGDYHLAKTDQTQAAAC